MNMNHGLSDVSFQIVAHSLLKNAERFSQWNVFWFIE